MIAGSLILTGCTHGAASTPPVRSGADGRAEADGTIDSVVFSGPYADDFRYWSARATTPKLRAILSDEVVTSEEAAEVKSDVRSCLADSGMTVAWDDSGGLEVGMKDGKYPSGVGDRINERLAECEKQFEGGTRILYEETTRNPKNVDTRPATVRCLLDKGLVPQGYAVRDYEHDEDSASFPFDDFDTQARKCMDDPLGLWAKRS